MQKINFQNLPSTSTPLNATNLNQMQDNIENAIPEVVDSLSSNSTTKAPSVHAVNEKINTLTTYSTTETIVGTWIDGKPIYRKCFKKTGTLSNITTDIANIDDVIKMQVLIKDNTNNYWRNIPWCYNSNSYDNAFFGGAYLSNTGTLGFQVGSGLTGTSKYIAILEYTKTTD